MGRGRHEFRIAAHLGCKLICPGKPSPPIRLVLFGPVSERQRKPAGQGAALHGVAVKSEHRPAPPHLPRARLPHALHPFLKPPSPASGGGGVQGATCGGANHSPIHFPSTTVQTLGIRIFSITSPPRCPRALCSILGIKRVRITCRVPSVLPSRQGWSFTQNVSIPFPTALGTLRCALRDPCKKRLLAVRPQQTTIVTRPTTNSDLAYPFTPFRIRDTRSFTKEAVTVEDCFDLTPRSRSEDPTLGLFAGRRADTSRPAQASGRTYHRGTGVLPQKDL